MLNILSLPLNWMASLRFSQFASTMVAASLMLAALVGRVQTAQADGTVSADFVFQLDNSVFESSQFALKTLLNGEPVVKLPDMVVQNLVPVEVSGLEMKLKYKFETAADYPLLGTEIAVASTEFAGQLNIAKVHVDGEVHQQHGGIDVIARLKADCTDIQIEMLPGKTKAVGSLLIQLDKAGQPTLTVPWFQVQWPEDSWVVKAMSCTGAEGFDGKLKLELMNYLKNSATFASQFKSFIDEMAAEKQKEIRNFLAKPIELSLGLSRIKTSLRASRLEALRGDRFQLRGILDFVFENGAFNATTRLTEPAILPTQSGFALSLPSGLFTALNDMAYRSGYYSTRRLGSKIPAFKDFRDSGVQVSVAWPELGWYPKEMDFNFDFLTASKPHVGGVTADGNKSLIGQITGDLKVGVWAQEFSPEMNYHKFGQFFTPVVSNYSLSIGPDANGTPALHLGFSSLNVQLSYAWDPTFTPKNPSVAVETIGNAIRDALIETPTSFPLGTFSVHDGLTLKPSGFRQSGKWLLLDMKK